MHKIEKAFFQIYVCLAAGLFLWTSYRIISFPYGVDYGEAPLVDQIQKIEGGYSLYKLNINDPPYIFLNYPPLYPLFVTGTHFVTRIPLFQAGRIVSLIFSLISGAIIGLFGMHLTGNKLLGVLAGILFIGQPYIMIWSSLARVDSMALAFSLLGLWIVYRKWNSNTWILLACLCFLASAFTRQTYILSGPLAGFIWLWYHRHRLGIIFVSLFVGAGLLIFGIINGITKGAFYTDIVVANINQYSITRILESIKQLLGIWPIILLISLMMVIFLLRSRLRKGAGQPEKDDQQAFLYYGMVFYSLGGFVSMLTIGKVGSSINYFMELIVACVIWTVVAINFLAERKRIISMVFVGILCLQLVWALAYAYRLSNYIIGTRWQQINAYDRLFQKVQSAAQKGFVLSDDYLDMVVLSGKAIYYEPATYVLLYKAGIWNPAVFSDQIKAHVFPLIVVGGNSLEKECCWPPPIIESIQNNYLVEINPDYLIITPKSSP